MKSRNAGSAKEQSKTVLARDADAGDASEKKNINGDGRSNHEKVSGLTAANADDDGEIAEEEDLAVAEDGDRDGNDALSKTGDGNLNKTMSRLPDGWQMHVNMKLDGQILSASTERRSLDAALTAAAGMENCEGITEDGTSSIFTLHSKGALLIPASGLTAYTLKPKASSGIVGKVDETAEVSEESIEYRVDYDLKAYTRDEFSAAYGKDMEKRWMIAPVAVFLDDGSSLAESCLARAKLSFALFAAFEIIDKTHDGKLRKRDLLEAVTIKPNPTVIQLFKEHEELAPLLAPKTYSKVFGQMDSHHTGHVTVHGLVEFCLKAEGL